MKPLVFYTNVLLALITISGCSVSKEKETTLDRYLFYQHGGVVTVRGDNAINESMPEWGPYEYSNILDSLRKKDFIVISEIRRPNVSDSLYAYRIVRQIDSLSIQGVTAKQILVVGASAGWNITLLVAATLKSERMHYVLMGGCWPETHKAYTDFDLAGHFLSIIEQTDPHGTCNQIFDNRPAVSSYQEIKLNTGLSHGFIYKGYHAWIDPLVTWYEKSTSSFTQ
jgi:hypothetical protein